jgi:hypothetical protein
MGGSEMHDVRRRSRRRLAAALGTGLTAFLAGTAWAGTQTLYPNGAGDATEFTDQSPATGDHWDKVDDAGAHDDDATYVETNNNDKTDLYQLQDLTVSPSVTITKVTLRAVMRRPNQNMRGGFFGLRSGATSDWGTIVSWPGDPPGNNTTFATYSREYTTNPATGNAWTGAEVNALQVGFYVDSSANSGLRATQIQAVVDYEPISVTATFTADDKPYDGLTTATLSGLDLVQDTGTDDVAVELVSADFDDADVGTDKDVNVVLQLTGADAADYSLTNASTSGTADITARTLNVTATALDKEYDGSRSASVTLFDDRLAGDVLTLGYGTARFDTKDVGTDKPVNVPLLEITGGADGGNYVLGNTSTTAYADITARPLTFTVAGVDRPYDGGPTATVTFPTDNRVGGDVITFLYTASFADENAALDKPISVTGISLGGADGGNYSHATTALTTADISPRTLTVTVNANDKPYDGTTAVVATLSDDRLGGDDLVVGFTAVAFDDAFVGEDKNVTATGVAITGGADQGNYVLAGTTATGTADITPILELDDVVQLWDASDASLYGGPTTYLIGADLNDDGVPDVVNVTTRGAQVFFGGIVGDDYQVTLAQELSVQYSKGGGAIDLDDDGDLDLVLGDVDYVKFAINTGGVFALTNAIEHRFAQPTVAIPFWSTTDSGAGEIRIALSAGAESVALDLVGPSSDHLPHLYILQSDGAGGWQVMATLDSFNVDSVTADDLDGDGDNDLLACNRSGVMGDAPVYLYTSTGGGYSRVTTLDFSTFSFPFSYGPTDPVDGTHFLDYVDYAGFAVGSWHRASVFPGSIGAFLSPTHVSMDAGGLGGYPTGPAPATAFGDMDGDGVVELVAAAQNTPLQIIRLTGDPNSPANRYIASLLAGQNVDLLVRDFDDDSNNAPDVVVGRSDGLWYWHNVNGGAPGEGVDPPPPTPPTPGENLADAISRLYDALDPDAADPLGADDPTYPNGAGGDSYLDDVPYLAGQALASLLAIDPRYRDEVPNFVFGDTPADQIETLRGYLYSIADALDDLDDAAALTTDPDDLDTIEDVEDLLIEAALGLIEQAVDLGDATFPFKRGPSGRRARQIHKAEVVALRARSAMQQAFASALIADDRAERERFIAQGSKFGRKAINQYLRFVRLAERGR